MKHAELGFSPGVTDLVGFFRTEKRIYSLVRVMESNGSLVVIVVRVRITGLGLGLTHGLTLLRKVRYRLWG